MTNENWTKKVLDATLNLYCFNLKKLNEYTSEFEFMLKLASYGANNAELGKITSCLAELIAAQTEYVNSLKRDIEKYYLRLSAESKISAKKIAA